MDTYLGLRQTLTTALFAAIVATSVAARADRVILEEGRCIEGKITRRGSRIDIELPSGTVTLPASAVLRIEKSEPPITRFEARYRALTPRDAAARLELADFCRDHELRSRERLLLREILVLDPDHAVARQRLGYVKTEAGWVLEADAKRAQGLVEHGGRWVTRRELLELERVQLEREVAAHKHRAAEVELDAKRVELQAQRVALERQKMQSKREQEAQSASIWTTAYAPLYWYTARPPNRRGLCDARGPCGKQPKKPAPGRVGFSPGPMESSMSTVKVPYRHP